MTQLERARSPWGKDRATVLLESGAEAGPEKDICYK